MIRWLFSGLQHTFSDLFQEFLEFLPRLNFSRIVQDLPRDPGIDPEGELGRGGLDIRLIGNSSAQQDER